ncbi:MAG TPA: dihydropteroate synthase [Trueperaceae bacterium]
MTEHRLSSRRPLPASLQEGERHVRTWPGTAVMGILNVTPDSFSDGGAYADHQAAIERGVAMAEQGALFVDVGGESTRPGAEPVTPEVEAERVVPVVEALAQKTEAIISIDTCKAEVARCALEAGAHLVNDVTGLRNPWLVELCAEFGVPAVIMHMQGEPRTMQRQPHYDDVVVEVGGFLTEAAERALQAGLPDLFIDPGIGFGKTPEHNLELLRALPLLMAQGMKVLVGGSRKSTIEYLAGPSRPADRDPGSIALHLHAASCGAAVVRVHDVAGHVQALAVWERLRE